MSYLEIFIIGIGLSMDAFAVSVGKGLSVSKIKVRHLLLCGLYFGGFQGLMPLTGYLLGSQFSSLIDRYDHWIAFILLVSIGANMIKESFEEDSSNDDFSVREMTLLAIATSIDALSVGVTFSFFDIKIIPSCLLIACTTLIISMIGVGIGNVFGNRYERRAQICGGIILILIGLRLLIGGL